MKFKKLSSILLGLSIIISSLFIVMFFFGTPDNTENPEKPENIDTTFPIVEMN